MSRLGVRSNQITAPMTGAQKTALVWLKHINKSTLYGKRFAQAPGAQPPNPRNARQSMSQGFKFRPWPSGSMTCWDLASQVNQWQIAGHRSWYSAEHPATAPFRHDISNIQAATWWFCCLISWEMDLCGVLFMQDTTIQPPTCL